MSTPSSVVSESAQYTTWSVLPCAPGSVLAAGATTRMRPVRGCTTATSMVPSPFSVAEASGHSPAPSDAPRLPRNRAAETRVGEA